MYMGFCLHVCIYIPHAFLVPMEVRRGHLISWNWSYRQLWASMWLVGIKPCSCRRAVKTEPSLQSLNSDVWSFQIPDFHMIIFRLILTVKGNPADWSVSIIIGYVKTGILSVSLNGCVLLRPKGIFPHIIWCFISLGNLDTWKE